MGETSSGDILMEVVLAVGPNGSITNLGGLKT